ncbi:putative DNA-binding transcriptional regulator YafY [Arthrobacter pigmenti]|uniref:Putative DNA-binding transcriptional regulator YafY n=1 Tax=Arthrobacter pigmenti TaxID=271432 RepID=A0A846RSP9_9MICC|nr:WYL domain-containing protein [Arthrobacter pigmenti]NJC23562.1 putative DNA-binding transcriptional regulator YafY [Arthrobacter pigmenti]
MRADRLIALLIFLQSRERVTAAQVAAELEVSLATARRDLEALSAAGIPVYVQAGRGGGWQLVGGAQTNLSGLSLYESRALFWLLGTAGLSSPETRVATMKLIQALPQSMRTEADRLATSIHYDHAAWGEQSSEAAVGLDRLRDAVVQRRSIIVSYTSRGGDRDQLQLRPLGLVAKSGIWYLVADGARGRRTYRVSRLEEVAGTDEFFDEPADFELTSYWKFHTETVEGLRSEVAALLRVPNWIAPILQKQFGRYCRVQSRGDEGRLTVEVRANLVVALAEQLAGWGKQVEVLAPPALRVELARIGAELIRQHGSAPKQD